MKVSIQILAVGCLVFGTVQLAMAQQGAAPRPRTPGISPTQQYPLPGSLPNNRLPSNQPAWTTYGPQTGGVRVGVPNPAAGVGQQPGYVPQGPAAPTYGVPPFPSSPFAPNPAPTVGGRQPGSPLGGLPGPMAPTGNPYRSPTVPQAAPAPTVALPNPVMGPFGGSPSYGPFVPVTPLATAPATGYGGGVPSALPPTVGNKPFANFTPRPTISPYMNLYRFNPNTSGLTNYYSMVRPQLEQNRLNRQLQGNIHGLQRNSRLQNSAVQQLNRQTQQLQGTYRPSRYMNYGPYYPSLQR